MKLGVFFFARRGFTLVELMVTLAIAAILATVAAPMLSRFLAKSQMNAVANEFTGAIQLARMEAVNRNACVTVCRRATNGGATCAGSDGPWTAGWIVYANPTCSGSSAATDPPAGTQIRIQEAIPEAISMNQKSGGTAPDSLSFTPRGVLLLTAMTMQFSDSRFSDNSLWIMVSKQARVTRTDKEPK